jgi:hypothetical protein
MSHVEKDTIFALISFPRSGQHLTERLIETICEYFGKEFRYCDFYRCCNSVPCKKNSNFLKNHDFRLDLKIPENYKKIVLYRTCKIEQLESFFRFFKSDKTKLIIDKNKWIENRNELSVFDYKNDKDSYDKLIDFINSVSKYYNEFVEKWVNTHNPNTLILTYSEIISDHVRYVDKLITFMEIPHDDTDVINILNKFEKIEYKYQLDPELYKCIENDITKP